MKETLDLLVAGAPFVVAGVALLGLGWSAVRAGVATFLAAVLAALLWPGLDASGLGGVFVGGFGTAGRVLFVLFGGLLLYNLLSEGGAVGEVSRFLAEIEPEKDALALAVVVGAAPFFESVTGFGVGVVISAPLLLAAGLSPLRAAVLATWGQCAVPWGALGIGTVVGADLSGLSFAELSDWSALLNLPLFTVYALSAALLAGGWRGLRRHGIEAVILGLAAGFATLGTSLFLAGALSGAVGGLAVVALFVLRRRRRLTGVQVPYRALAPYGVLLVLILVLGQLVEGPGAPLLLTAGFAAVLFRLGRKSLEDRLAATVKQWLPTAGAVLAFVLAGGVVAASGAAQTFASLAAAAGALYPAAAALVAAAGGALTGSNAASNALFMPLQAEAARSFGTSLNVVAAVQNVAGSHASMLAPQRVILAGAAVGMAGREGEIVRWALPPVAVSVVIVVAISLALA